MIWYQFSSALINLLGNDIFSTLRSLSVRQKVLRFSLLYSYYSGRCSNALYSLARTITARFHHAVFDGGRPHSHSFRVSLINKFHWKKFFPRAVTLWNKTAREFFPDSYNLGSFKSSVNRCLSFLSSEHTYFTLSYNLPR